MANNIFLNENKRMYRFFNFHLDNSTENFISCYSNFNELINENMVITKEEEYDESYSLFLLKTIPKRLSLIQSSLDKILISFEFIKLKESLQIYNFLIKKLYKQYKNKEFVEKHILLYNKIKGNVEKMQDKMDMIILFLEENKEKFILYLKNIILYCKPEFLLIPFQLLLFLSHDELIDMDKLPWYYFFVSSIDLITREKSFISFSLFKLLEKKKMELLIDDIDSLYKKSNTIKYSKEDHLTIKCDYDYDKGTHSFMLLFFITGNEEEEKKEIFIEIPILCIYTQVNYTNGKHFYIRSEKYPEDHFINEINKDYVSEFTSVKKYNIKRPDLFVFNNLKDYTLHVITKEKETTTIHKISNINKKRFTKITLLFDLDHTLIDNNKKKYEQIEELLEKLTKSGKYRLGIASFDNITTELLKENGILHYFDPDIIAFSDDETKKITKTDIILDLINKGIINIKDIIFFDNRLENIKDTTTNGIVSILIDSKKGVTEEDIQNGLNELNKVN